VGGISILQLATVSSVQIQASILRRAQGRTYVLQYKPTLGTGTWQNVPGLTPLYNNGTDHWTLNTTGQTKQFFRVVVSKD
jgi:hypothetical protein